MFFGAHPDDVELNCGGTVISLTGSGKQIGIIDLTKGELSTRGNLKTRAAETKSASRILGISVRENLNIEDGNIEINTKNRLKVITALRKYRPEIIFTPYPFDRHPDHTNASDLIRQSFFYSGLRKIETPGLDAFAPRRIFLYRSAYDIPVSFVFDISKTFGKKLEAIKCYSTQFYNSKSREPETYISTKLFEREIETRARFFGFKIGVEFGEPFYSYEILKANEKNLLSL